MVVTCKEKHSFIIIKIVIDISHPSNSLAKFYNFDVKIYKNLSLKKFSFSAGCLSFKEKQVKNFGQGFSSENDPLYFRYGLSSCHWPLRSHFVTHFSNSIKKNEKYSKSQRLFFSRINII